MGTPNWTSLIKAITTALYGRMNPFFTPLKLLPIGDVATANTMIDEQELLESRYFQEWLRPQGLSSDSMALKALQNSQRTAFLMANRLETSPRYGRGRSIC
jgi:hypothetical protein